MNQGAKDALAPSRPGAIEIWLHLRRIFTLHVDASPGNDQLSHILSMYQAAISYGSLNTAVLLRKHKAMDSHPVTRQEAAGDGHHAGHADGGVQERRIIAHAGDRNALGLLDAHLPKWTAHLLTVDSLGLSDSTVSERKLSDKLRGFLHTDMTRSDNWDGGTAPMLVQI